MRLPPFFYTQNLVDRCARNAPLLGLGDALEPPMRPKAMKIIGLAILGAAKSATPSAAPKKTPRESSRYSKGAAGDAKKPKNKKKEKSIIIKNTKFAPPCDPYKVFR